jgi:hypothetical protein
MENRVYELGEANALAGIQLGIEYTTTGIIRNVDKIFKPII